MTTLSTRITGAILLLASIALMSACSSLGKTDSETLVKLREAAIENYINKAYQAALPQYLQLLEVVKTDAELWFQLGNIYARLQQPEPAVNAYRHAVTLNPRYAKAWHNMGIVFTRQAANSFTQMTEMVEPADPLYAKSIRYADTLLELLGGADADPSP